MDSNNLKKGHGGARPGAGMPKGKITAKTVSKELAREALREVVIAEMAAMAKAQIASAKGIHYLVVREIKTGKFVKRVIEDEDLIVDDTKHIIEVYAKDPSAQAFAYLIDQALDKAKNPVQEVALGLMDSELVAKLEEGRKRVAALKAKNG